jgi:hypothetical protein
MDAYAGSWLGGLAAMGSVYNTISLFCQPTLITIADHQDAMDPNKKEKGEKGHQSRLFCWVCQPPLKIILNLQAKIFLG